MIWFALAWVLVFVLVETVVRISMRVGALDAAILLLPRRLVLARYLLPGVLFVVFAVTFVSGIYVTAILVPVPVWGQSWIPLLVAAVVTTYTLRVHWPVVHLVRVDPIEKAIRCTQWEPKWGELQFRNHLVEHLANVLDVRPQPERPLSQGTRVDVWFTFEQCEYFLTLKRLEFGSANQQRLVMQGEVEDILHDLSARNVERFHLIAVIGVPESTKRHQHQLDSLSDSLIRRVSLQSNEQIVPSVVQIAIRNALEKRVDGSVASADETLRHARR